MRWTRSLIPTLREDPADAEAVSHKLMLRAGLVRQLASGIYVYLPVGQRVIDRVNAVIREEMNRLGGQEITMPVLQPAARLRTMAQGSDESLTLLTRLTRERNKVTHAIDTATEIIERTLERIGERQ